MSKKIKKFLKKNSFLNDKYNDLTNKDTNNDGFVSDEQIKGLLPMIKEDNRLKIELNYLENKTHIKLIDLVYFLIVIIMLPLCSAYYSFKDVFKVSDVGWIISLGGSFGVFVLSSFIFNLLFSKYYMRIIGGESFKEVNKKRALENLCIKLRNSKVAVFYLSKILSQFKKMDQFYKNRTIGNEDPRETYTEVLPNEFTSVEKELINIILSEIPEEEYILIRKRKV